jgi:hypothetical protein
MAGGEFYKKVTENFIRDCFSLLSHFPVTPAGMSTLNVTALYPNTPTPNLSPDDWDFDPGYNLMLEGDEVRKSA